MEGAQKDERTENQGDRSFIQRDVYTQYCGYKMGVIYALEIYQSYRKSPIINVGGTDEKI